MGFHKDILKLCHYLSRNLFPKRFIERNIKRYLDDKHSDKQKEPSTSELQYIKLPYTGEFSDLAK